MVTAIVVIYFNGCGCGYCCKLLLKLWDVISVGLSPAFLTLTTEGVTALLVTVASRKIQGSVNKEKTGPCPSEAAGVAK